MVDVDFDLSAHFLNNVNPLIFKDDEISPTIVNGNNHETRVMNVMQHLSKVKFGCVICFFSGAVRNDNSWSLCHFRSSSCTTHVDVNLNNIIVEITNHTSKISSQSFFSSLDELHSFMISPSFHSVPVESSLMPVKIPAIFRKGVAFSDDFHRLIGDFKKNIHACIAFSLLGNDVVTASPLPSQSVESLVKWLQPGDSRMFLTKESPVSNKNVLVVSCLREQKVTALKAKVSLAICKPYILHALRSRHIVIDRSVS
eukprot:GDKJ01040625.1.p1 GENE.GDKJ01040625.1~~GDKJ01040625.1.p1  ORF type:complete len:256 (+),score=36.01 GDKJ01040625.1:17-784(+)